MVHLCDGASLAHLGYPDMRVPISYALHHPDRAPLPVAPLDLVALGSLTFEPVDADAFPCLRLAREAALAGGTAPCVLNAANEIAVHAFLAGRLAFLGIAEVIDAVLERARLAAGPRVRDALRSRPASARGGPRAGRGPRADDGPQRLRDACETGCVSLFLALLGLALLIVLHELGHFAVAKAVGMRVERACLFFPPLLFKVRRGETEYGIGAIPLGGYVKITGMNPQEIDGLEPEVAARAYYNQAGLEAGLRDPRRPGRQPRDRVRDLLVPALLRQPRARRSRSATSGRRSRTWSPRRRSSSSRRARRRPAC